MLELRTTLCGAGKQVKGQSQKMGIPNSGADRCIQKQMSTSPAKAEDGCGSEIPDTVKADTKAVWL